MFGLSVATELIQGSTERTWNCVLHFVNSLWSKFNHNNQNGMPKSRKRHHSRSRSRSRSPSRDRSRDRDDKHKRNDSHDKERDGKRRKIDSYDSPPSKRSVSEEPEAHQNEQDMKNEDIVQSITGSSHVVTEDHHKKDGSEANQIEKPLDDKKSNDTKNNEEHKMEGGEVMSSKVENEVENDNVLTDNQIDNNIKDVDVPKMNEKSTHIGQGTADEIVTAKKEQSGDADVVNKFDSSEVSITSKTSDHILDNENLESAKVAADVDKSLENDKSSSCSNKDISSDATQHDTINGAMEVDSPGEINESTIDNLSVENNKSPSKGCGDEKVVDSDVIEIDDDEAVEVSDLNRTIEEKIAPSTQGSTINKKKLEITPKKYLSPKQMQKKMESEKKRLERQKEKEEKERKKNEDRERIMKEKQKKKEEKQRELEQKQKEKELKDEQKKKEREEKELKKREKEEKDEQKRKEKEQEKLKKQEKEMEKQKEEEKKQKAAAAFANFFVSKRSDNQQEDKKNELQATAFMAFEVKSDMKLPPARRSPLSDDQREILDIHLKVQNYKGTYLNDIKSGKIIGKCPKTWPYEDMVEDDDVEIIEEEESRNVGETICEDIKPTKLRAKFLKFHENRRPAYFGTWRKKSKLITPRKPLAEDTDTFNYAEDSDDDWEEEEQGESLTGSDDEADKENDDEKDDYEVDNEFFVPHGHLSDDEVDDEENKRMSPESMKQKLKLLKDEFDQDMKSKTHKLKPKAIGCIWYRKDGGNVDEAIHKYLQPLAIICRGNIEIKSRSNIFTIHKVKQKKQLNPDVIPLFIKFIHGCEDRKKHIFEKFKSYMFENGNVLEFSKRSLLTYLNENVTWKKIDSGPNKNKMNWIVNADIRKKYSMDISVSNVDSDK